jgi:ligand-binding sensor domain-containing protein
LQYKLKAMKNAFRKIAVLVVAGLVSISAVFAVNWANISNFTDITAITVKNNQVWVAAKGGLLMYDKTNGAKTFFQKRDNELPSISIERVAVSPISGDIWIGTYDNGLAVFNGTWQHLPFPQPDAMLYEMKIAQDGAVWCCTSRGIFCYRNNQFYTYLPNDYQSPSICWDIDLLPNGKLLCANFTPFIFDPVNNTQQPIATTTFAYSHSNVSIVDVNTFIFSTDHGEIAVFNDTTEVDTFHVDGMMKDVVTDNNNVRMLIEGGHILNFASGVFTESGIAPGSATALCSSADGLWIGSSSDFGKLILKDLQNVEHEIGIRKADINSNWVQSINSSADGNILITHNGGIQKYDLSTNTFTKNWTSSTLYFSDAVEANGKLYAGSSYSGLIEFTDETNYTELGDGILPSNEVDNVTTDPQGNVWLCGPGYIAMYNGTTFTVYDNSDNANLTSNLYTREIYYDVTRSAVWVTTYDGIFKIQNGAMSFYNENTPGIQQYYDAVETISEDTQHNIWFGTVYGGILKYDGTNFSTMLLPETVGNQFVTGIQFIGNAMYVSDNLHGVWKYENMQWDSMNTGNTPLTDNFVTALYADAEGNLWMGNLSYGIDVFNKDELTLGVKNITANNIALNVYPNPTTDKVRLDWNSAKEATITIYSIDGKVVNQIQHVAPGSSISLSEQQSGIYFINVITDNSRQTLRVVKN